MFHNFSQSWLLSFMSKVGTRPVECNWMCAFAIWRQFCKWTFARSLAWQGVVGNRKYNSNDSQMKSQHKMFNFSLLMFFTLLTILKGKRLSQISILALVIWLSTKKTSDWGTSSGEKVLYYVRVFSIRQNMELESANLQLNVLPFVWFVLWIFPIFSLRPHPTDQIRKGVFRSRTEMIQGQQLPLQKNPSPLIQGHWGAVFLRGQMCPVVLAAWAVALPIYLASVLH